MSVAGAAVRVAWAPDPWTGRTHRRLAPVLAPHLQHRGDAVEAPLLRLGAWLSVAAGQAAAAVPRPVRVLYEDRPRRRRRRARATTITAPSCSARSSYSRSSARRRWERCAAWWTTRPWFARSSSRGMAIPLSVVLLAFFNLCLNLIVVTIFALAAGVAPDADLARGAADRRAAGGPVRPASRCCCRRCSCTCGTSSRSGRCSTRSSSTPRR